MLRLWYVLVLFAAVLLLCGRALGQAPGEYLQEPLPQKLTAPATVRTMERTKAEGLTKADFSAQWEGVGAFVAYYREYQFGKLKDPAYSAEHGKIAQAMLDDLDRAQKARSPAAVALSRMIVAEAAAIAAANYQPTARANAALLLALVDETPADLRGNRPPVPASRALGPLVLLYRSDANPDGVRAAALQGLVRHVQLGAVTNEAHRDGIKKLMLDLAKSGPPAHRSPEAHAYLQRYAVDILTVLAEPNIEPETALTLVSLSIAPDKPNHIAAYAASKVGQFQAGKAKVDRPSRVLATWAARAAQTIDQELNRIAALDPPQPVRDQPPMPSFDTQQSRGGQGYGAPEGYDAMPTSSDMEYPTGGSDEMTAMDYGGMADGIMSGGYPGLGGPIVRAKPQPLEVITSRRRINHVLQQLHQGVTGQGTTGKPARPAGLLATAAEADKAAFDKWLKTVAEVVTAVNADTLDDRTKFVDELKAQSAVLKNLAGIKVEPVEAAPAVDPLNDLDALTAAAGPGSAAPAAGPAPGAPAGEGANAGRGQAPGQPNAAPGQPNRQAVAPPAAANTVPAPQPPRAGPNQEHAELLDALAP